MFTEQMIRLFAIVLERDGEKVTEALLKAGAMQFITTNTLENGAENAFTSDSSRQVEAIGRLAEVRKRTENFLAMIDIAPRIPASTETALTSACDVEKENNALDAIASELQNIREQQRIIQNDILRYEEIQRQIDLYGTDFASDSLKSNYSYISLLLGSLPVSRVPLLQEKLGDTPAVIVPINDAESRRHFIMISMKRDREHIAHLLMENGWIPAEVSSDLRNIGSDVTGALGTKLAGLREKQRKLQDAGRAAVLEKQQALTETWTRLRIDELRHRIQSTFRRSSHTLLFSGWLPFRMKKSVAGALETATGGRCYVEWLEPDEVSDLHEQKSTPPVKFRNPKVLAPFQMLVANFGIPEYGTIDPTPFIVITYLVMFGLMFPDIGQGAVISLLGFAGTIAFKNRPGMRNISWLLIWCGGASVLFGTLFGSFFGFSVVKPLWFDFHGVVTGHARTTAKISSIFDILGITIKFGIAVISCGLLFNWINLLIKRRWVELIFDKGGLLGGWMYFGGIYCARYLMGSSFQKAPGSTTLLLLVAAPALLLFLKGPLHAAARHQRFAPMKLLYFLMEWIVELLEVFSGYLSNTLSFMRVAGLGIAHVSLMVSFFTMAEMVRGSDPGAGATVVSVILLIAGNVMVIALEGLSAGIQALRLNYYEFFTKFFHGTGKLYQPVSLQE